jgi:hypothetical protein
MLLTRRHNARNRSGSASRTISTLLQTIAFVQHILVVSKQTLVPVISKAKNFSWGLSAVQRAKAQQTESGTISGTELVFMRLCEQFATNVPFYIIRRKCGCSPIRNGQHAKRARRLDVSYRIVFTENV